MEDLWKNIALLAIGALSSGSVGMWSLTRRPTRSEVEAMIAKDLRDLNSRFDRQDKILEKMDRHLDETRDKVDNILIDVEAQRRVRSQNAVDKANKP